MPTARRPPLPGPVVLLDLARQQLAPVIAAGTVRLLYEALWDRGAADYARQRLAGLAPTAMRAQVLWVLIAHHDTTAEPWPKREPFAGPGRPIAIHATARHVAAGYQPSMHPALRHVRRELLRRPTLALAAAPEPGPWQAIDLDRAISITEHAAAFHTAHGAAETLAAALHEATPTPPVRPGPRRSTSPHGRSPQEKEHDDANNHQAFPHRPHLADRADALV